MELSVKARPVPSSMKNTVTITTRVETLYEQYKQEMYSYIYYQVSGNQAVAEDLTAELFIKVVQNMNRYEDRGQPRAWLYAIARNVIADHHRSKKHVDWVMIHDELPCDENAPDEVAHLRVEEEKLIDAMAQLTPDQRDVLLLRFIEGQRVAETAHIMNKQQGAVKTLTRRALAAMRRALAHDANHDADDTAAQPHREVSHV